MESVSWPQVRAWRMRRQFLDPEPVPGDAAAGGRSAAGSDATAGPRADGPGAAGPGVVDVARRLAGVQAQVQSAAELAIGLRQHARSAFRPGAVGQALDVDRSLIKTWAMRGTLHLLPADTAGAYLAVCAANRRWELGSWQKAFGATPADLAAIAEAAADALDGGVELTRERLVSEIVARTGSEHLAEVLGSGWGTLLKPLAWWGVLCQGPARGNRVTFVSPADTVPGWTGVPGRDRRGTPLAGDGGADPGESLDEAARVVIRDYLAAYGPSTPEVFDKAWLSRGVTRKAMLRGWFAALGDELTTVDVEGAPSLMLTADVDELVAQRPSESVRLLAGFDQYILGPGTGAAQIVPADRRGEVSRAAGWISPVVLRAGRAAGTWRVEDDTVEFTLWDDVAAASLEAEVERVAVVLGRPLRIR
jgi:hypothetical protein